jgi:hypothetical protein
MQVCFIVTFADQFIATVLAWQELCYLAGLG